MGSNPDAEGVEEEEEAEVTADEVVESARQRLMCIVTVFELLSGQGSSLGLDPS